MTNITRSEYLTQSKERALVELGSGSSSEVAAAFASFVSDLNKHPETKDHVAIDLGMKLLLAGHLSTRADMEKFISDFG